MPHVSSQQQDLNEGYQLAEDELHVNSQQQDLNEGYQLAEDELHVNSLLLAAGETVSYHPDDGRPFLGPRVHFSEWGRVV